jgi:hypothetical protein
MKTYFSTLTTEERRALAAKGAETRRRNAAARKAAVSAGAETSRKVKLTDPENSRVSLGPAPLTDIEHAQTEEEPEGRLDDLLSDEEIVEIYAQARVKVANERKAARKKELMDRAVEEERRGLGLIPQSTAYRKWLDELVEIDIRIARLRRPNGSEAPPDPILIDGRAFHHGRRETVTRAQAITLLDIMNKQHQHVAHVDGRPRVHYNEQIGRIMYQGGFANGGIGGPEFGNIHRRPPGANVV